MSPEPTTLPLQNREAGAAPIERVHAREVLDSRGQPTVEVDIWAGGALGRAIVPSGASTGRFEALELRDGDPARYRGRGVRRAVAHVNEIIGPALTGADAFDQAGIDRRLIALDGTPNKARLGANALLGASLAAAHAAAACRREPLFMTIARLSGHERSPALPLPMVNMISGGLHAGGNLDLQDFLAIPKSARSVAAAMEMIAALYAVTGELLQQKGYGARLVADEGGYGPELPTNEAALEILMAAAERAGLAPGRDVVWAIDVAATHFFGDGRYHLRSEGRLVDSGGMIDLLAGWVESYPIASIEDGLAEDDWEGWVALTRSLGRRVQLVGDDLFTTHPERLARGIAAGAANAVLIKVNQIGTLTETLQTMQAAFDAGYACVVSARSGETEDSTIADLAVGTGAGQIKIGSITRSERLAKYNQLLRLEETFFGDKS